MVVFSDDWILAIDATQHATVDWSTVITLRSSCGILPNQVERWIGRVADKNGCKASR
jgi:hypothetical protein